jgi:CxxC motif-containing protein (DUF1111 family)
MAFVETGSRTMRATLFRSLWALGLLSACALAPLDPGPPPVELAHDPGPRPGVSGVGAPLAGLTEGEQAAFAAGLKEFVEAEEVDEGLGPTMNLDSCAGCHLAPAVGGSSPPTNPQVAFATRSGARNVVPPFIRADGPVREVRFVRSANGQPDGGVHSLFTVAGRTDAPGCSLTQPDFAAELAKGNLIFRIPTPMFGAGLIEQIPDSEILGNQAQERPEKQAAGIAGKANIVLPFHTVSGQPNKNGNDGTLGRFGWKAQNKSLLVFSGEAYNVEMGITNEAFPTEREEAAGCQFARQPNSVHDLAAKKLLDGVSAIEKFAFFMRFLAPPAPSAAAPGGATSIERGHQAFRGAGCALCHTPTLKTGDSQVPALRRQPAHLYSDLLVHDMGHGLADGVMQGQAGGREFRTAPLWGLGQRLFFLHDGRTADLREAVRAHFSLDSEANEVIRRFYRLPAEQQQDVYNFLRSQ